MASVAGPALGIRPRIAGVRPRTPVDVQGPWTAFR